MTTKEYLERVLKSQNLADDSQELKDLQQHREDVEKILREAFPDASPTIQYGGSNAKGTLDREAYDLDVICYFRNDDTSAGETLMDIFDNVGKALGENYDIEPKTSSIRLRDKKNLIDFHIDVIPGRYVDDSKSDCFIHQNGVDKERLKTNLNVQIDHVKNSGVVPAIRLLKLWKTRRGLQIKQFVFELLIIKLLKDEKTSSLETQLTHVWSSLAEAEGPICVEDPANPCGNDLMEFMEASWPELSARAKDTLSLLDRSGWESIFGAVDDDDEDAPAKKSAYVRAAASVSTPTKPWLP
jgi:hypothetical protein